MLTAEIAWATKIKESPDGRGGLARVSMNRNGLSESVANQLGDIRLCFDDQAWPIDEGLFFSDDNISASEYSTKERPGFIAMCEAVRQRRLWLIVVTEVSRLTRVVEVAVDFVKLAQAAGGVIIMTTEGKTFDLKTSTGVHDFYDAVVGASRESGTKSDRIKRNKRKVAEQGRYHGGPPRYGRVRAIKDQFGRVTNTGSVGVDIVEHEAEILNETIDRVVQGWPLMSIVRDLKKRGVVRVGGKPFTVTTLRQTISSKHLVGIRVYKGREYPGAYPAIIKDRKKWEKAMAILKANEQLKGADARSYLLTGWCKCGKCANKMSGHCRDDGQGPITAYRCNTHDQYGDKVGCGLRRLAEPIELLVTDAVLYRYDSPGFIHALRRSYQEDSKNDELGKLIDKAQQLQGRLNELEDAWTKGTEGLDLASMLRMKTAMQAELKTVNAKLEHSAAGQMVAAITTGGVKEAFGKADFAQQRVYIGLIVEEIIIDPVEPTDPRPLWTHEATGKSWRFDPSKVRIKFKY
ncbi:recombinase family protein [Streptomyces sp. NPDC001002]